MRHKNVWWQCKDIAKYMLTHHPERSLYLFIIVWITKYALYHKKSCYYLAMQSKLRNHYDHDITNNLSTST